MFHKKNEGFTLVELMVVIVIIGVLAALAIPKFTDASAKAKLSEAPTVIASWESAQLACVAEKGYCGGNDLLVFQENDAGSKWFSYKYSLTGTNTGASAVVSAQTAMPIGKIAKGANINSTVSDSSKVAHAWSTDDFQKYLPNFKN